MKYNKDDFFGYSVRLSQLSEGDGGGWIATVPELRGCLADGETPDEAYEELKEVLSFWLEVAKEKGKNVPEPTAYKEPDYSGKTMLRMPKNLHRILAEQADYEGVSLNQYMVSLLSYNAGRFEQSANKQIAPEVHIWLKYVVSEKEAMLESSRLRSVGYEDFDVSKIWEVAMGRQNSHVLQG